MSLKDCIRQILNNAREASKEKLVAELESALSEKDATGNYEETADLGADTKSQNGVATSTRRSDSPGDFGDYQLVDEIAHGGMGVVYRARQQSLSRIVALKLIRSGQLAGDVEVNRFYAEARAAARLEHVGILPIYEVGQHHGQHFFTMQLVEGGSLQDRLRDDVLPPREAAEIVRRVAEAIQHAHDHDIIHRDLKPGNILIDSSGEPKVADFGLAKQMGDDGGNTMTGGAVGTPSYMPPEQAAGESKQVGPLSDVYSIGAVLYCLLTGRPPFRAATHVETLMQVLEKEPASPRSLNNAIPKNLETICLKCLRKDVTQRYSSAQDLADDLQRWLNNEPIRARPVGRLEKSLLWCKRRPAVVCTIAIAVSVLIVVSFFLIERRSDAEATRLVAGLLRAETAQVANIIIELDNYRAWAKDDLEAAYADPPASMPNARLHAALALLREDDSVLETLKDRLLTVSPAQFAYVRDLMDSHKERLITDYWKLAKDQEEDPARRFPAACALATYDPENGNWKNAAFVQFVANHLVGVSPSAFPPWRDALRGVQADLVASLGEIFRDDASGESVRLLATDTLADYQKDEPQELTGLLIDSDPKAFKTLFPVIERHQQVAVDELQAILDRKLKPTWKDQPLDPSWKTLGADVKAVIESANGMIGERFAFCQMLPWDEFADVAEKLSTAGYRPTRVRPYMGAGTLVAVIWVRDGKRWELQSNLTRDELPDADSPAERNGLVPEDLAAYFPATRFTVLWGEPDSADEQRRLVADLSQSQLSVSPSTAGFYNSPLAKEGFASQCAIAVWTDDDGKRRYGGIWSNQGAPSELNPAYAGFELVDQPQWDVAVAGAGKLADPLDEYRRTLTQIGTLPADQLDAPQVRLARARAQFRLGQFEPALADLDLLIEKQPVSAEVLYLRAWTLARLDKREEADEALSKYLDQDNRPSQRAYVQIVHAAWTGDHEAALTKLNDAASLADAESGGLYDAACAASLASLADDDSHAGTYVDRAVELLRSAVAAGYADAEHMSRDADLVVLHGDARFLALLAELSPPARYAAVWRADVQFESKLVTAASPQEMLERVKELLAQHYRPAAITMLAQPADAAPIPSLVFHRPIIPDEATEQLAVRQATAAATLLRLEETEQVWPLFQHQVDPRLRSYLLHRLTPYGADPAAIIARLETETEVSRRRVLVLAIGEFARGQLLSDEQTSTMKTLLVQWYSDEEDAGIHGACQWTLGQLGADAQIAAVQDAYATGTVVGERQWYLTREGNQTMVILDAEEPFLMGSPVTEAERFRGPTGQNEIRHRRRIGRRFAISAHEVPVAQFEQFREDHVFDRTYARESNAPANMISWYDAAAFCNWLSEQEGIPRDQWCYDPQQQFEEGMILVADYLQRIGYRLPTETEWEYACRAGTTTARCFGETETLLGQYAWYTKNSGDQWLLPVGSLKPNDTGLFDMQGNAMEWCQDRGLYYVKNNEWTGDSERLGKLSNSQSRVLRGGSFFYIAPGVSSASRSLYRPDLRNFGNGFRPARTYP